VPARPSRVLVTGAAGFIGSHLSERLVADGVRVRGVDAFTDYYPRERKEANLAGLADEAGFDLVEADLASADLAPLLAGCDAVVHLAAQPGVRASWGDTFARYVHDNITATQRLLEAVSARPVPFAHASSSSVYGDAERLPTVEDDTVPLPVSPYGVTKLAAEGLGRLYARERGVPAVALRYFTVYGPRQRPDMAFTRFARAVVLGEPITVFGDGEQSRDFTYVSDAVEATYRAVTHGRGGAVYNVGGGERASVNQVIAMLEELSGGPIEVVRKERQAGDARHTGADTSRAEADLGWRPTVGLREGLARQLEWARVAFAAAAR
jgi:nucleoside-diphosphate-sugar epimerase